MMKTRLLEWAKNLLLIALTCSAIYLTLLANSYYNLTLPFLPVIGAQPSATASAQEQVYEAARPVKMAVMNSYGRYGAAYDDGAVGELYDSLGRYLGEALGTMGQISSASSQSVREVLDTAGIFLQFPGYTPISALALWLGTGLPSTATDVECDMFVVALDGGRLYYHCSDGWYTCPVELRDNAAEGIEGYRPNSVAFAFELAQTNEVYEDIDGFCLVVNQPVLPRLAAVSMTAELRTSVASRLGFNPYSDSSYVEENGDEVFTANNSMLRLSSSGLLSYNSPLVGQDSPGPAERIETARQELAALISPGDGVLYFSGESYDGSAYNLYFDYYVSGVRVVLPGGQGACVTLTGGQVTGISLWLRSYQVLDGSSSLLPAAQAAAITTGSLEAVYTDSGTASPAPGWRGQ